MLILASGSPRRKELLSCMGLTFKVDVPAVDETCALPVSEAVKSLAERKAAAAAVRHPDSWVLGADTLVCLDGIPLGKPMNANDAFRMLQLLSGKTHQVYTGVAVIAPDGKRFVDGDRSDVTFCDIPEREMTAYTASGEPLDKAGAYAIQGRASMWITRLEGSYTSVIGLPLHLVRSLLLQAGYPLFQ